MDLIAFNVPGLPEPQELSGEWALQPISVHANESGLLLGLTAGAARGSTLPASTDGVLCVYPGLQSVAYLFSTTLQVRQRDPVPAIAVTTHSDDGTCTIFGFTRDSNDNPLLIVNILPAEYLPKVLRPQGDSSVIDLTGIDDRIEIRQSFHANSFGIVSRLTNELTKQPNDSDNTIFELYDDPGSIADVCAFYMSRALGLSDDSQPPGPDASAKRYGVDPIWKLLWKPVPARSIFCFATIFILSRLSINFKNAKGESTFALKYNSAANRRDRGGDNAE